MRTFLVVEKPERLEAAGAEYEILHGSVMRSEGLATWLPRNVGCEPTLPFADLATAAKSKGFAVFALPPSAAVVAGPGAVTEEIAVGDRKILVRHAVDWTGSAFVRFQADDGGVVEFEAPGWLMQAFAGQAEVAKRLRDELTVKTAELETTGKMLDGMTRECATLKAGGITGPKKAPKKAANTAGLDTSPLPPGGHADGPRKAANASGAAPSPDGPMTVADVQAELARTLEGEATATAPKRKYRGSGGDAD